MTLRKNTLLKEKNVLHSLKRASTRNETLPWLPSAQRWCWADADEHQVSVPQESYSDVIWVFPLTSNRWQQSGYSSCSAETEKEKHRSGGAANYVLSFIYHESRKKKDLPSRRKQPQTEPTTNQATNQATNKKIPKRQWSRQTLFWIKSFKPDCQAEKSINLSLMSGSQEFAMFWATTVLVACRCYTEPLKELNLQKGPVGLTIEIKNIASNSSNKF